MITARQLADRAGAGQRSVLNWRRWFNCADRAELAQITEVFRVAGAEMRQILIPLLRGNQPDELLIVYGRGRLPSDAERVNRADLAEVLARRGAEVMAVLPIVTPIRKARRERRRHIWPERTGAARHGR